MSGKNDYLNIDLNDLVNKEIRERIEDLEKRIEQLWKSIQEKDLLINNQKVLIDDNKLVTDLFWKFRQSFSGLKPTPKDSLGYEKTLVYHQFEFISNILENLFSIKKESNYQDDTSLAINLAVNYYKNKETVINVLKLLMSNADRMTSVIESFKMPYDYSKDEVLKFVKNPQYNTNGVMFGINRYWTERGASKENMPYDLIMKHPNFLDADVFDQMLETIKTRNHNSEYFFEITKYNKNITKEHISKIGNLFIDFKFFNGDLICNFIKSNLDHFDRKTLDFFYTKITIDNQFKMLHWENFPVEYQQRFLMNKPFEEILKILNTYSCKWTIDQKEELLKKYFNNEK